MKTYAIFPTKTMTFCVNGEAKQFTPEDQVGVVSVDGVSLMDLLGAIQFHHCKAIELDEAEMLRVVDEDGNVVGDGVLVSEVVEVDEEKIGKEPINDTTLVESQVDSQVKFADNFATDPNASSETSTTTAAADADAPEASPIEQQFIADGIDPKIAFVLAEQGCTPESIRDLIAEGFDLTELESIGKTRAEALLAVYQPK